MRFDCPSCSNEALDDSSGAGALTLVSCKSCMEAFTIVNSKSGATIEPAIPPKPLSARIARGSVMDGVLEHIDDSIEQLPTIPVATQRVISAIHDPLTSNSDLAEIINDDATLSMRVLRLANSAVYGGRQSISDLKFACARLGLRNVASVAHVVANAHVYHSGNPIFSEMMTQLWHHAVATARLTETVGMAIGGLPSASLFLSGLVHDIGKPVLLDAITNRYKGRTGELKSNWNRLLATIEEFSPYVGLRVAQHWKLAPEIRFTTFHTNAPGLAPRLFRRHAYLVALASGTAEANGYGVIGDSERHTRNLEALAAAFAEEVNQEAAESMAEEAAERIVSYVDAVAYA